MECVVVGWDPLIGKTEGMSSIRLRNHRGFTLIELLAVMAIVAVLAGIVSVAVGGTGETSKDTQTKQDATTINTAAADFFSAQVGAEVLVPKTVEIFGDSGIEQKNQLPVAGDLHFRRLPGCVSRREHRGRQQHD